MANTKISALTSATTPLAGTEVLPIVQSSATVKVAANDLTVRNIRANATTGILQVTGPAAASTRVATVPDANFTVARTDAAQSFTGDQTLSTGNLIIGTSGKGIDFSATAGAGTSELLADYEEGTWTPVVNFGGANGALTYVNQSGYYTKVGDQVTVWCYAMINLASTATGSMTVSGLPFSSTSGSNFAALGSGGFDNTGGNIDQPIARVLSGSSSITMMLATGTNNWNTVTDSGVKANSLRVYATIAYKV